MVYDRHANEIARARAGGFCEYLVVGDSWRSRHCSRKAVKNGRCKQHDPDEMRAAEARRIAARDEKWERQNRWRTGMRRSDAKRQVLAFLAWAEKEGHVEASTVKVLGEFLPMWAEREIQ